MTHQLSTKASASFYSQKRRLSMESSTLTTRSLVAYSKSELMNDVEQLLSTLSTLYDFAKFFDFSNIFRVLSTFVDFLKNLLTRVLELTLYLS